ncbi:unnamed protein product [Diplocarpon coronariae]|nr:hypothetical protein JHW43_001397 [Diplocarpon mali]
MITTSTSHQTKAQPTGAYSHPAEPGTRKTRDDEAGLLHTARMPTRFPTRTHPRDPPPQKPHSTPAPHQTAAQHPAPSPRWSTKPRPTPGVGPTPTTTKSPGSTHQADAMERLLLIGHEGEADRISRGPERPPEPRRRERGSRVQRSRCAAHHRSRGPSFAALREIRQGPPEIQELPRRGASSRAALSRRVPATSRESQESSALSASASGELPCSVPAAARVVFEACAPRYASAPWYRHPRSPEPSRERVHRPRSEAEEKRSCWRYVTQEQASSSSRCRVARAPRPPPAASAQEKYEQMERPSRYRSTRER